MGLRLDAAVSPAVGHSTQEHIPVVRGLTISNDSDDTVENIKVIIRTEPPFSKAKAINVKSIGPREKVGVKNADVTLIPEFLSDVTERANGNVSITAEKDGEVIAEIRREITIIAKDEWLGVNFPETTGAFITTDDPDVLRIAANAAKFLDAWIGDAAMDRYASGDRSKVRREIGAIYAAVQQFDLRGTEAKDAVRNGCRISSAEKMIDRGSGTSLDLTLLFLSCAGSVGLNTVIIFMKRRAVAGIWMDDTAFKEPVQNDITTLMRAVRDGSLMLIDCDGVTSNRKMDIESSETSAKKLLLNESDFLLALDVRCLRGNAAPVPSKRPREKVTVEKKNVTAGSQAIQESSERMSGPGSELTKRELWESRLLDLSFDNELLSMRMTDTLLPIMTNNLTALKDALSSGEEFDILGKPAEWDNQILNEAPFELSRYIGRHQVLIEQEFRHRHLRSPYSERDVNRRLTKIHDICVSDEERCENSVFIVLGLLKWFDTDGKIIYSPLIMMPAKTVMRSVNDGITVKARDDEPIINKTLLEKLKRTRDLDISLDPLPSDRTGADTERVFEIMKDAIRATDGWDIVKGAFLGVFRPERYDMWNNLRGRSNALFSNKLTKSLMEGRLTWNPPQTGEEDLYKKMMLVFAAEHSQMRVLKAASLGNTFIFNCPSNGRRRETISNIIASAVHNNKTVLLVSENDGSLRSMKRCLNDIGIGRFCLYLNSGSANKQKVLEHFRTALDSASSSYVEDFSLRADGIEKMCAELSAPVRAIQRRTNTGKNLHELVLLYDSVRSEKIKHIEIPDALVDRITPDSAERWERMVESLITAARALGHPSKSSLSDTGITKHDNTTGLKITEQLKEWIAAAEDAERISELLISSVVPAHNTHATASLASLLLSLESLPDGMLNADDLTVTNLHVHDLLKILRRSFEIINNISRSLSPDTAEESIDLLRRQHSLITSALDRLEGIRLPINMDVLNGYLEEILSVEEKMMPLLKLLRDIRTEWYDSVLSADTDDIMRKWMEVSGKRLFSGNAKRMFMYEIREHLRNQSVTFDGVPNALRYVEDHGTHTKYVKRALEAVDVLNGGSYSILGDDCRSLEKLYLDTLKIIESLRAYGDPTALFKKYSETPEIRRYATELVSAALRYDDEKKATEELLLVDISKISSTDDIRGWKELSKKWLANIKGFGKIAEWNRYRRALEDEGLRCVIDAYMEGMDHDLMSMSFRVSMLRYLMDSYISKEPSLASFDAKAFMQRSSTFRDAMDGFIAVCRAEANATLESRVPDISSQPQDAEALQRTILTSGRGATIRSLMKDAKSVIPAVCPCMIMGPSSVSHYLDHEQMFDIVIIEDASSMPTHRAIDIITRGKDVIISGDRQHMPASLTVNNNIADTESIMDACSSVSLPKYDIYSMDDENLAEFRNSSFYDMKMGTFPYARKEEPKIRTVRVNGCYNRASKSNDIEAEAIVRDVLKRLKACNNKISLGIITFSDGQKEMIEDMLTKELARDAAREGLMHTGSETLFVRTINDMRGHERDTIIISPGIGKDPAGRLTADLSPFDRPNGERRLNAAMAYARNEIVIFSSLESTDIPDGKGAGTDALRKLLVYTEKGLPPRTAKKDRMRDLIAEALTEKGFTVHCDIGNSGMTVDIAIADPQHPDRYIMGVLVDSGPLIGPNAMDNEYTYIRGLNREGWEIRRVLTLDWLKDPARTINDIADAVDKRTQDPERWSPKRKETPTFDVKTIARTSQTKVKPEIVSSKRPYVKANIAEKTVSLEALFSTSSRKMIERDMMKVIDAESPVAASVVAQRLCDAYGMKRSVKLMDHLMMMINRMDLNNTMTPWNTKVLWKTGQNPASYESFRGPVEGEKRPVRDIAPKELTNAIFEIVLERRIVSGNDMIIAAAKLFGNDNVTDDDKNIITRCVNIAIDEKIIRKDGRGNLSV